ncbi:hypothetical protein BFR57_03370 [Idiomarina sp. MD25a]|uniref:hypothetical protein n=1 Tax=Idiomarina sp. MD25a TaxID=1889913 RepID=UPI0008F8133D|nr:hypothetical protein [Idiomarina sp. MD25a]OIM99618.1 hypothetical protein BFR57_03370 [Idiomarina sp. MD25a]
MKLKIDYVIVPKNLSPAVIDSQVVRRFINSKMIIRKRQVNSLEDEKLSKFRTVKSGSSVYCRELLDFVKVYIWRLITRKKFRIYYDFRGIVSEESFLRNRSRVRRKFLSILERFAFNKADKVLCVSENMKNYLNNRFYVRSIYVEACKCDKSFLYLKPKENAKNKIIFCYLGSISKWQCFEKACLMYKQVESSNTEFRVFTGDQHKALSILEKYSLSNFFVASLSRAEVPSRLREADFGFLLRDDNIVNQTASPIKFAEYVCSGVIPIMTEFVGDYSSRYKDLVVITNDWSLTVDRLKSKLEEKKLYSELYSLGKSLVW